MKFSINGVCSYCNTNTYLSHTRHQNKTNLDSIFDENNERPITRQYQKPKTRHKNVRCHHHQSFCSEKKPTEKEKPHFPKNLKLTKILFTENA